MGDYTSEAKIYSLMPQLPNTTTVTGYTVTAALVAQAITDAEAEINGYIAHRYSLPFSSVPVQIRAIADSLSQFYTYLNIYSADNMNRNNWSEGKSTSYDIQLKKLESIANGDIVLTLTNGSLLLQASTISMVTSSNKNNQPIFDLDTCTSWQLDPDRADGIANDRN